MPELEDQNEIDAYYLSDPAHPRAAGVLWPAIIERRIDKLFDIALRPDKKVRNELLQPSGALGSFAVKVRIAYMLGWVGEEFFGDLLLVAKIRNRFAHVITAKDFDDQSISAWLKNMRSYKILPGLLTRGEERLAKENISQNRVFVSIVQQAMADGRMGFRFCITNMIDHLDKCAANMKRNLEGLTTHWMVADEKPVRSEKPSEPT
jgi:DNA-binding MltR family transcriptional regulator